MKEIFEQFSKIVEDTGLEVGLVLKTTNVIASTDRDTKQFSRLAIETCKDLLARFPWRISIGDDPWVKKDDGTFVYELSDDTDTPMFDSRIIKDGVKWRYLSAKGLTYAEPFRFYEKRINDFGYFYNGYKVVDTNENARTTL